MLYFLGERGINPCFNKLNSMKTKFYPFFTPLLVFPDELDDTPNLISQGSTNNRFYQPL